MCLIFSFRDDCVIEETMEKIKQQIESDVVWIYYKANGLLNSMELDAKNHLEEEEEDIAYWNMLTN